jgi:hypothetical protein
VPDRNKKFHTIALSSSLFKGRSDWYYCFLKSEKIAHVLYVLSQRGGNPTSLSLLSADAGKLPTTIAYFAAGKIKTAEVLASLFSLLSRIRMAALAGELQQETALILLQELEQVTERIASDAHPSPFLSAQNFSVPPLAEIGAEPISAPRISPATLKDNLKGHGKGHKSYKGQKGHVSTENRMSLILNYIRTQNSRASIRDISKVVTDCSEKTIQRELATLIAQGLVRKEGERRWSVYLPA